MSDVETQRNRRKKLLFVLQSSLCLYCYALSECAPCVCVREKRDYYYLGLARAYSSTYIKRIIISTHGDLENNIKHTYTYAHLASSNFPLTFLSLKVDKKSILVLNWCGVVRGSRTRPLLAHSWHILWYGNIFKHRSVPAHQILAKLINNK